MLGGVGGRHASVRRRGSSPGMRRVGVGAESPPASPRPVRRRRAAIAASDHKTCALIHTRLKLGDIILQTPNQGLERPRKCLGQAHCSMAVLAIGASCTDGELRNKDHLVFSCASAFRRSNISDNNA